jgi:cell division protein FtsA
MNDERAVVLDLGSGTISCLAAEIGPEDDFAVLAVSEVASEGVEKGRIADLEEAAKSVDACLRKVEEEVGERFERVNVGIGGAHLRSLNSQGFMPIYPEGRTIRSEDVLQVINHSRQVVLPSDREQLAAMPREYRIDGERGIREPLGRKGRRLEVVTHMVTGDRAEVELLQEVFNRRGREIENVLANGISAGKGILGEDDMESGAIVVDIGKSTTDIGLFLEGSISYTSSIPVGSGHITQDLATVLKTTLEHAEDLKRRHGAASAKLAKEDEVVQVRQEGLDHERPMQRAVFCEIIESRARELARLVLQSLNRSGLRPRLGAGVFLTGNGSLLEGWELVFRETFPTVSVACAAPRLYLGSGKELNQPRLSAAVGLARFVLEREQDQVEPASGSGSWKERIMSLKSLFGGTPNEAEQ